MVTIRVKAGNTERYETLCRTCSNGHIISGYRATEEEVYCRTFYIEREIQFPVRECTFYEDRRLANKKDMEEIAWPLRSTICKPYQNVGFAGNTELPQIEPTGQEIIPAAADSTESKE